MIRQNHTDKIKHKLWGGVLWPLDCALHPRPEGRGFTAQ